MGELGIDTAVAKVADGRYTARLSADWEIWGPMGGYVASVALRAAGAESPFSRPASFFCQYLGVAAFDTVDVAVTPIRAAKTALAQRVEVTQGERRILEATVWSVGDVDGLEHDETEPPDVPHHDELASIEELLSEQDRAAGPPFPFWNNLDEKPVAFRAEWPPPGPLPATWQTWLRFAPVAAFEDPWLDGCRALILLDVQSWPAASRPHVHEPRAFYAPSLDLYVAFHDPRPGSDWLLADGSGRVARNGLMAWDGRLWSTDGRLVASGQGQLLCRRLPDAPS